MDMAQRLLWYMGNIWDYGLQMLPCALLSVAVFFCLGPRRKKRLALRGLASDPCREGALVLFLAFCAGLAALTLTPPNFWTSLYRGELVPFPGLSDSRFYWEITIFRDLVGGPWVFFMLLGNLGMFAPLGFFPALLWDKPSWKKALLTGFCSSLLVEVTQLFVGRSSDINDLILNSLGALGGYWIFLLLRRLAPCFTAQFRCKKQEDS